MQPEFRHVCDIEALVGPIRDLGPAPHGRRRIIDITGGTVRGPWLTGSVVPGGADWQYVRADGVIELEARYCIRTGDGTEIAVTNRGLRRAAPDTTGERLSAAGITADVGTREVTIDGRSVDLTGLEFDILVALLRRPGRVIPRDALLKEAGRSDVVVGERTVDVHISRLRKKLGDDPPQRIKTVRGVGYVLSKENVPGAGD